MVQFSEATSGGQEFQFDFHKMLHSATKGHKNEFTPNRDVISIADIQLDDEVLFAELLAKRGFFKAIGLTSPKHAKDAKEMLPDNLKVFGRRTINKQKWCMGDSLATIKVKNKKMYDELETLILDTCVTGYAASTRDDRRETYATVMSKSFEKINAAWEKVSDLFSETSAAGKPRLKLADLADEVMTKGRKVIVDLDPSRLRLGEASKLDIVRFVFKKIAQASHSLYKKTDQGNANCLVVLDEAGRFIAQNPAEDRAPIANYITEKVKELRKYCVGFQFITQDITEIKKDIYKNLHYRIYGVGMSVGADGEHIRKREGNEAFEMYQTLPDPRLSGTFSFMVCGAIIALGTTGKPMYIEGYGSDQDIMDENKIPFVDPPSSPTKGQGKQPSHDSSTTYATGIDLPGKLK